MEYTTIRTEHNPFAKAVEITIKTPNQFASLNILDTLQTSSHMPRYSLLRRLTGKRVHRFSVGGHKMTHITADRLETTGEVETRTKVQSMLDLSWIMRLLRSLPQLLWETEVRVPLPTCEELRWEYRRHPIPLQWEDEQGRFVDHDRARISTARRVKEYIQLPILRIMESTIQLSRVLI